MTITLQNLTPETLPECVSLRVTGEQLNHSLLEDTITLIEKMMDVSSSVQQTIHADGTMVGYVAYAPSPDSSNVEIHYFLIDERYQGRGYGEGALRQVISRLCAETDCETIGIGYMSFNVAAARLYEKLGFVDTADHDGEHGDRHAVLRCREGRGRRSEALST